MSIAEIKAYMKANGITYEELAERSGLSLSAVTKILGGFAKYPRADTMQAIVEALGLDDSAQIAPVQDFVESHIAKIKAYMKTNGITYEELSEKSGIPVSTLNYIFTGRTAHPRVDTMRAIEATLGLDNSVDMVSVQNRTGAYIAQIKAFMRERKITYKDLSEKSGISLKTLEAIFAGYVQNPRIDTILAIQEALGLSGSLEVDPVQARTAITVAQLKEYLKTHRITYLELSERSGVPIQTLKGVFSGVTANPRIGTVQAITAALGLNVEVVPARSRPAVEKILTECDRATDEGLSVILGAVLAILHDHPEFVLSQKE